jgi:uncharacterized protein YqjF (DUF2071 family)
MRVAISQTENSYFSSRLGGGKATIKIRKGDRICHQSALDVFLTARYRLYSVLAGRLISAEVQHAPWELQRVSVLEFEENVRRTMGVEFLSTDFVTHFSVGVDTKVGRPKRSLPIGE